MRLRWAAPAISRITRLNTVPNTLQPAPLWKRLSASVYDLLPLAALLMIGTALLLPLTGGMGMPRQGLGHLGYQLYVAALIALYYIWSWHRGGQTIGMRAWRLRVRTTDAQRPPFHVASLRFLYCLISIGALGIGLLWPLIDARKRMWHDIWSGTEVVAVPKP